MPSTPPKSHPKSSLVSGVTNPRKGLKRLGMRSYTITGPLGTFIIERERPRKFSVRRSGMHPAFFFQKFKLLRDARSAAEVWAAIEEPDDFPYPEVPKALRRWHPRKSV